MSDTASLHGDKKSSKPSLSLTRTFFGRIRPDDADVSRYPRPGDVIQLEGFGGRLRLNDGTEATLKDLIDISLGGVIVFAYPKAHTPGCTKQVCLFRDAYQDLTSLGFAIYGLSRDSIPNNSSFSEAHRLPFRLICDEKATLITALGLNKKSLFNETMRAVVVLNKSGKVLASMAENPSASLESIAPVVQTLEQQGSGSPVEDVVEDNVRRVPATPSQIPGGSAFEEPSIQKQHGSRRRNVTRNRSLDRQDSSTEAPVTPTTPGASTASIDLYAERVVAPQSTDRTCIICGHRHSGNQTCAGQVEMIKKTVAHLEETGAMSEQCQRELANKLALVAGELAVISSRIDATYRQGPNTWR